MTDRQLQRRVRRLEARIRKAHAGGKADRAARFALRRDRAQAWLDDPTLPRPEPVKVTLKALTAASQALALVLPAAGVASTVLAGASKVHDKLKQGVDVDDLDDGLEGLRALLGDKGLADADIDELFERLQEQVEG